MKVFIVSCSLRQGSLNHKLAEHIASLVEGMGHEADLANMREFDMPLYNFDIQESDGWPPAMEAMVERITSADAWVIVTPEFNWSVPGNIKNAIDWISRVRPVPITGKSVFLAAASPSMTGGVRGLLHFRVSLESLGVWTYPKVFALAQAAQAFDDDGGLANADIAGMLKTMLEDYCSGAQALNNR